MRINKFVVGIIILSLCLIYAKISLYNTQKYNDLPKKAINSSEIKLTQITPVLDTKIDKDKNLVCCTTFQLAWNELTKIIAKGTLEVENSPEYLTKLNELVNQPPLVSDDSYIAFAGFAEDGIVNKINQELVRKFNESKTINFPLLPSDILVFAYLLKNLKFENEFYVLDEYKELIQFNTPKKQTPVKTFGIINYDPRNDKDKNLFNQIEIKYFMSKNYFDFICARFDKKIEEMFLPKGFIIKLVTTSPNDELIISTLPPKETLKKTFEDVNKIINNDFSDYTDNNKSYEVIVSKPPFNPGLWTGNCIKIPKINMNLTHSYNELLYKFFINNSYYLIKANQTIEFKLNEKGTMLKSKAYIIAEGMQFQPPNYIVNSPFVIYLRNKLSKYPYFIAYICNEELLESEKLQEN